MKAQCLPFAQIPHTTRLFTDFLAYSPSVQPFYPHSPHFSEWSKPQATTIQYDPSRRERVSSILERQNKSWDASPQTFACLTRLRRGAAAVVTGQQVGLFGGPMFAIYKALTAVKLAEEATAAGVDAVPVFWLATSDHDLAALNFEPRSCRRAGKRRAPGRRDPASGGGGRIAAGRFRGDTIATRIVSSRGDARQRIRPPLCATV